MTKISDSRSQNVRWEAENEQRGMKRGAGTSHTTLSFYFLKKVQILPEVRDERSGNVISQHFECINLRKKCLKFVLQD